MANQHTLVISQQGGDFPPADGNKLEALSKGKTVVNRRRSNRTKVSEVSQVPGRAGKTFNTNIVRRKGLVDISSSSSSSSSGKITTTTTTTTTSSSTSPPLPRKYKHKPTVTTSTQKPKTLDLSAPHKPRRSRRHSHQQSSRQAALSPAQLLLLNARRAVALSVNKTSIMDFILDGGDRSIPSRPLSSISQQAYSPSESTTNYSYRINNNTHNYPISEPILHTGRLITSVLNSHVFQDSSSLDLAYWHERRCSFLNGIGASSGVDGGEREDDWNGLMTLAKVSAERSTALWSDASTTSPPPGSDVLLAADDEDVQILDA